MSYLETWTKTGDNVVLVRYFQNIRLPMAGYFARIKRKVIYFSGARVPAITVNGNYPFI